MTLILSIIVFFLGASIGSFLSVVIFRIKHNKKGIFLSRSICPYCKKKLKWQYLIPLFSWLFLRGKCGYCGKKISIHYFLLELAAGMTFLSSFLYWNFLRIIPSTITPEFINYSIYWPSLITLLLYLIIFTLLIAIFFYDLLYKEIPDRFSVTAIGVAVATGITLGNPKPLDMLIGAGIIFTFFALQFFLSKGKWIGGGDLRLGVLMGVMLGWQKGLVALIIAYMLGSFISIALLIQKKVTRKSEIPFGPFLILGIFMAMFYGQYIINWYKGFLIIP